MIRVIPNVTFNEFNGFLLQTAFRVETRGYII